jgi:hypothetical protein
MRCIIAERPQALDRLLTVSVLGSSWHSSRSQVLAWAASGATRFTWDRASASVRRRGLLVMAIVTHLVTRPLRMLWCIWDHSSGYGRPEGAELG